MHGDLSASGEVSYRAELTIEADGSQRTTSENCQGSYGLLLESKVECEDHREAFGSVFSLRTSVPNTECLSHWILSWLQGRQVLPQDTPSLRCRQHHIERDFHCWSYFNGSSEIKEVGEDIQLDCEWQD